MTIRRLLKDSELRPNERQLLDLAYRRTLKSLGLVDRNDPVCEIVAWKIIKVSERGITNVVAISQIALKELGPSGTRPSRPT